MALIYKQCLPVQYSVFKALDLKIKFLDGSLVFVNPENSIDFVPRFALFKLRFILNRH